MPYLYAVPIWQVWLRLWYKFKVRWMQMLKIYLSAGKQCTQLSHKSWLWLKALVITPDVWNHLWQKINGHKENFLLSVQAHEFVDEQLFEQNCIEGAQFSRSPSLSSQEGFTGTCCTRRSRKRIPLPNASLSTTHTHTHTQGLQELSAIHIQCSDQPNISTRYVCGWLLQYSYCTLEGIVAM